MCRLEVRSGRFGLVFAPDTNTLTISVNTSEVPIDWDSWLATKLSQGQGGAGNLDFNVTVQDLGWVESSTEFKLLEARDEADNVEGRDPGLRGIDNHVVAITALQDCFSKSWFCCTYKSGQQLLLGLEVDVQSFEPRIAAMYRVPKHRALIPESKRLAKILKRISYLEQ